MNILLLCASWNNRGDESAIRAMIDELKILYPNAEFTFLVTREMPQFPYENDSRVNVAVIHPHTKRTYLDIPFLLLSKGRFALTPGMRSAIRTIKKADLVLHAPGGPTMGEVYPYMQFNAFFNFFIARANGIPYGFYAPSMGPFNSKFKNFLRKKIYNSAQFIATREPISAEYAKKLELKKDIIVTMDSAIQHKFDPEKYENQLDEYKALKDFLAEHKKAVGITITHLQWNSKYSSRPEMAENIEKTFKQTIQYLTSNGYGVIFIPQLFGKDNDYDYMNGFMTQNCFIIDDKHDCYFQQHIISKLHFVIGMRYHSNIFSAKMKTPFIAIPYEQKMSGFAKMIEMDKYCVDIETLSGENVISKINELEQNYDNVKQHLSDINEDMVNRSYQTTLLVKQCIEKNNLNK